MNYIGGTDFFRFFKIISVNNKKIESNGRYKTKGSPRDAAKKAFTQLSKKYKTNKLRFIIKETTQGSSKKSYGPYLGEKIKLRKPLRIKYKGQKKPILIKYETKIQLIKNYKIKNNNYLQKAGTRGMRRRNSGNTAAEINEDAAATAAPAEINGDAAAAEMMINISEADETRDYFLYIPHDHKLENQKDVFSSLCYRKLSDDDIGIKKFITKVINFIQNYMKMHHSRPTETIFKPQNPPDIRNDKIKLQTHHLMYYDAITQKKYLILDKYYKIINPLYELQMGLLVTPNEQAQAAAAAPAPNEKPFIASYGDNDRPALLKLWNSQIKRDSYPIDLDLVLEIKRMPTGISRSGFTRAYVVRKTSLKTVSEPINRKSLIDAMVKHYILIRKYKKYMEIGNNIYKTMILEGNQSLETLNRIEDVKMDAIASAILDDISYTIAQTDIWSKPIMERIKELQRLTKKSTVNESDEDELEHLQLQIATSGPRFSYNLQDLLIDFYNSSNPMDKHTRHTTVNIGAPVLAINENLTRQNLNETTGSVIYQVITNVDNIVKTKERRLLKKGTVEYYPQVENLYTQLHSICERPIIVISSNQDDADFRNLQYLQSCPTEQLSFKCSKPTRGPFHDYTTPALEKAENIMKQVSRKRAESGAGVEYRAIFIGDNEKGDYVTAQYLLSNDMIYLAFIRKVVADKPIAECSPYFSQRKIYSFIHYNDVIKILSKFNGLMRLTYSPNTQASLNLDENAFIRQDVMIKQAKIPLNRKELQRNIQLKQEEKRQANEQVKAREEAERMAQSIMDAASINN